MLLPASGKVAAIVENIANQAVLQDSEGFLRYVNTCMLCLSRFVRHSDVIKQNAHTSACCRDDSMLRSDHWITGDPSFSSNRSSMYGSMSLAWIDHCSKEPTSAANEMQPLGSTLLLYCYWFDRAFD